MQTPLISIIVPVYNVEKYLPKCLESILAQTITNWEAILIDDGSKDKSGEISDEYAEKDPRFVVVHKQNEGVAKARITAFEHSKGELVTFIDADDYVSADYLEKLSRPIIEDEADMVSCDYLIINGDNKIEPKAKLSGIYEGYEIKSFISDHYFYDNRTGNYGMTIFLCTKMVKREYVSGALQQGVGLWLGEDQISVFAMLIECRKLVLIPDRLYNYVQHEGQAVKRYDESLWDNIITLLGRYESHLPQSVNRDGLRKRTWLHIAGTLIKKMMPSHVSVGTYVAHISKFREDPYINAFFRQSTTGLGIKNDVAFWLLKFHFFKLLYLLMSLKYRKQQ